MSVNLRIVGLYYNNEIDYQELSKPILNDKGQKVASIKTLLDAAMKNNSDKNVKSFTYKRDNGGIRYFSVTFEKGFVAPISGKDLKSGEYEMQDRLEDPTLPDLVWQYYITNKDGYNVTAERTRKPSSQHHGLRVKDFTDVEVLEGDTIIFRLVSILNGPSHDLEKTSARAERSDI